MPLGDFKKEQVRQIAKEKNLPVADKSESQEICFIPDNRYGKFLWSNISDEVKSGQILNQEGKVIGKHRGIIHYTIGQRKRIGIPGKERLYVTKIDLETNSIIVGKKEDVYSDELVADDINLIFTDELKKPMKLKTKIRYNHKPAPAMLSTVNKNKLKIKFDTPQWAITPGQAIVFYISLPDKLVSGSIDKDKNNCYNVVLGGGTIISKKDWK